VVALPSRMYDFQIETPFRYSQGSLQDYVDCPRRFRQRYIERLAWPALDAEPAAETERRQQEGLLFHRLAHQHILGLPADMLMPSIASSDLQRWWKNYTTAGVVSAGYAQHPELSLSAPVGGHRVLAKYDLVSIKNGQAIIYDWKTYARRPRDEWLAARWQTRVYRAMLVRAGAVLNGGRPFDPPDISMLYWFADFPDQPAEFAYDDHQFGSDWSAIEGLVQEISTVRNYPQTDDDACCRFCVFRSLCDRGDRAGPWQGLDADIRESSPVDIDFEQISEVAF
jgi:hypothetical protein